jgi:two-component system nitrate/nitrite response regulator NarL
MIQKKVLLADDHPVVLRGLAELVAMEPGFKVVATTTKGCDAFALINRLKPDLAVLDVHMPDVSGLTILRKVWNADLAVRVVFLTAMVTPVQIADALAHGIGGILLKEAAPDKLIECLRSVADGGRWISEELANADPSWTTPLPPGLAALTPREREISELACSGLSNKLIARRLGAVEGTVKIHLHNIFQKLHITNRTALAALYYQQAEGAPAPGRAH